MGSNPTPGNKYHNFPFVFFSSYFTFLCNVDGAGKQTVNTFIGKKFEKLLRVFEMLFLLEIFSFPGPLFHTG